MDPVDPNAVRFDPNEPDCTNGDFFCRLCLSSMNSESMWSSHIAGKRHIKNAQKFPNGLPNRDFINDEDSYERPPKRERFDDGYDFPDNYPPHYMDDDYYHESYFDKRPPIDYVPTIKPNIVFDYGHTKKLEDPGPPPEINKIPVGPSSVVLPPVSAVSRSVPVIPAESYSVLDQLLQNEKRQAEMKDDFFEKINQREMAKEVARELSKKGVCLETLKSAINPSEKKDDDFKANFSVARESPKKDMALERLKSILNLKDKKDDDLKLARELSKKGLTLEDLKSVLNIDDKKDDDRKTKFSRDVHNKSDKRKLDVFDLLHENKSKKRSHVDDEKDSKKRSSSSKKSSTKSKSELDDLDPDKLTPDILDSLLSARLKYKNAKSSNSDEICTKKHSTKEVDLDDPKILAKKLESLPTMEFLKIMHQKLVKIDLKTPEELKMLLKIVTDSQEAISKKLPPELQSLVKPKSSGSDGDKSRISAEDKVVSQTRPTASSNKATSQSSAVSMPTSSITTSVNPTQTFASSKIPAVQVPPSIPNISASLNQGAIASGSNVALPQNQMTFSYPSSIVNNTPVQMTVASTPAQMAVANTPVQMAVANTPAQMAVASTPAQMAVANTPLTNVASVNNPAQMQSMQNYYNMVLSMYQQNRQPVPANVQNMYYQLRAMSRIPFPPPPPPPPLSARPQLPKEIWDAMMAKVRSQTWPSVGQSKPESSASSNSDPKLKDHLKNLSTLKSLEAFEEEYKKKKSQQISNSKTSEKSKSSSSR